ncbi:MAG: CRTAC1 family protein [Limisphaerales bacterium]
MACTVATLVLATLGIAAAGAVVPRGPEQSPEHRYAKRQLEVRRKIQEASVQRYRAFRGFKFADRTDASGIRFEHRAVDDAGRDYKAAHYDHGSGLAVADVDGDGRLDLYFCTQLGSNQLWRNLGGARFEDITEKAGLAMVDQISVAPAFGDVDNDGDPDLFVTTVRHGNRFFLNQGNGRFLDATAASGLGYVGHSSGAVFLDFDRDGRLDLFVANVGVYTSDVLGPGGFHRALVDAFQGHLHPDRTEPSLLYRNLGDGRFEDVSKRVGIRGAGWFGDATFADPDRDGYPDIYLPNMQGDDRYYVNLGGKTFEDRASGFFPKTAWGATGVKFFDHDQDGRPDLFVTDMHSDMTGLQTEKALSFGQEIEKAKSEAYCSAQFPESYFQGSTNNLFGNAFYRALGDGTFLEASDELGLETYWPWGASVGDLNADGFPDVLVTAGMGYPFRYAINSVLLNEGGRRFFDAEFVVGIEPRQDGRTEKVWFTLECGGADRGHPACGSFTGRTNVLGTLSSRSSAICDLDGDGDLDVVLGEFHDRPRILLSDLADRRPARFLQLKLEGRRSNRDGLGARVAVRSGGRVWTQFHDGKSGYLGHSAMPLYFGLADSTEVEAVEVLWPSGRRQVVTNGLRSGITFTVRESEEDP